MKMIVRMINSLAASLVTTLIILTASFLILLFSSAELGRRTAYFGAVFFDSTPTSENTIGMEFGINNILPVIITFVVLAIGYYILLRLIARNRQS